MDDLAELRRLINQPEQDQLRELQDRLDDKEQRTDEIAAVLPEALTRSRERSADLIRALQPAVEGAVRESVENRPKVLSDALRPIIGAVVWRSIIESVRDLPGKFRRNDGVRRACAVGGLVLLVVVILGLRSELRWRNFIRRLNAEPGIVVTQAEKGWIFHSRVAGLRDPVAADPVALARAAGVNPARLRFVWKAYLALDDSSVLRRFEKRFGKPPGVQLDLANGAVSVSGKVPFEWIRLVREEGRQSPGVTSITENDLQLTYDPGLALARFNRVFQPPPGVNVDLANRTLRLAGNAPYEWLASVREGATNIPGIEKISEEHLQVAYDNKMVLQRFTDRFNLPDSVIAKMDDRILILSGEAPHAWLTRVRRGAPTVPGIDAIDENRLIDLDQRAFEQSKSFIAGAFVYFLATKDAIAPESTANLERLPEEIQRCLTAATRLGLEVEIEVRGYADSVGKEQENFQLSQRRADALRDYLVNRGLKPSLFKTMGMGTPPTANTPTSPEGRRVTLQVVPKT